MKKLGLICVTLVVALGLMGVGYGAWGETLSVNGKVSTGTWSLGKISDSWSNDAGTLNDPLPTGNWAWSGTPLTPSWTGRDSNDRRANTTCTETTTIISITLDDYGNINKNYYPSIACRLANDGSIPVKVSNVQVTSTTLPAGNGWSMTVPTTTGAYDNALNVSKNIAIPVNSDNTPGEIRFTIPRTNLVNNAVYTIAVTVTFAVSSQ